MSNVRSAVHGLYKKAAEAVLPPLSKSAFEEKRVLTPEEFVAAGDYLVRACPTWSWEAGDAKKARPYLPAGKQYLVTRNVPCLSRASELERYDPKSEFALSGDDDGWTATHADPSADGAATAAADAARSGGGAADDIPSIDDAAAGGGGGAAGDDDDDDDDDDVPDIGELELQDEATATAPPGDVAADDDAIASGSATLSASRAYDLYITYDQYYQVPRLWLVGYDGAHRAPLPAAAVLDDVSEEHAKKTVTVDPHPHLPGLTAASIHPCRHAEVMKKLADNLIEAGREFRADQYLVLFLKFIASVVPTIEYDYTMSVGGE